MIFSLYFIKKMKKEAVCRKQREWRAEKIWSRFYRTCQSNYGRRVCSGRHKWWKHWRRWPEGLSTAVFILGNSYSSLSPISGNLLHFPPTLWLPLLAKVTLSSSTRWSFIYCQDFVTHSWRNILQFCFKYSLYFSYNYNNDTLIKACLILIAFDLVLLNFN